MVQHMEKVTEPTVPGWTGGLGQKTNVGNTLSLCSKISVLPAVTPAVSLQGERDAGVQ